MNTTTAAQQAGVTVATIRTWCRYGAVVAAKVAGRWIIDTASLARRIEIGQRRRKGNPVEYTIETMTAIGGNEWQRGDKHRVYLNDWQEFTGIQTSHYRSGSISSASLDGRGIANGRIGKILGTVRSVYFDAADGKIHVSHYGADAIDIRYLDGKRDTINLIDRIFTGINAAIAAL